METYSERSQVHEPRRILITGGAGFIGSNYLLRSVPRNPDVSYVNLDALTYAGNHDNLASIASADNYTFIRGDIADSALVASLFDRYDFTTVLHFAAESHVDRSIHDPLAFVRTNVVGTVTLLEAARAAWAPSSSLPMRRFYHISTDEVFGSLGKEDCFTEKSPYDPRSPYSASKASSDHFVRAYGYTYGLPFVISNCSNNYGPYQYPEKLIPLTISRAIEQGPVPIYGKGENIRDWLYVEDHCEAIETILRSGRPYSTYLIGGDGETPNLSLVTRVLDLVDEFLGRIPGSSRQLIRYVEDRPGHDFRYAMDYARLRRELGWRPVHTLESGLRKTVRWYIDNRDWLRSAHAR